jgi:hypothetical protein
MARISTFERMQLLKRHEESVAEQISGLDTVQGIVRFARAAYRLEADGLPNPSIRSWGTWARPLKIPQMLLIQPTVAADVYSVDYQEFCQVYGVTPEQFIDLAREGLVVPNLIGDSDLEKKEEDSAYSRHPHLANILDFSITNCRINAVRRGKVFEAWGYSREKQESTSPDVQRFFDSVAYAN